MARVINGVKVASPLLVLVPFRQIGMSSFCRTVARKKSMKMTKQFSAKVRWFHAACQAIDDHLLSTSDDKWECTECRKSALPPFNSVDAIDIFHFDFQKTKAHCSLANQNLCGGRRVW